MRRVETANERWHWKKRAESFPESFPDIQPKFDDGTNMNQDAILIQIVDHEISLEDGLLKLLPGLLANHNVPFENMAQMSYVLRGGRVRDILEHFFTDEELDEAMYNVMSRSRNGDMYGMGLLPPAIDQEVNKRALINPALPGKARLNHNQPSLFDDAEEQARDEERRKRLEELLNEPDDPYESLGPNWKNKPQR